jgi:hypothetical protein
MVVPGAIADQVQAVAAAAVLADRMALVLKGAATVQVQHYLVVAAVVVQMEAVSEPLQMQILQMEV